MMNQRTPKKILKCDDGSISGHKIYFFIMLVLFCITSVLSDTEIGWYSIRTNGFPQRPENITVDSDGALRITSRMSREPGVWYYPPGGDLLHIAGDLRENDWGRSVNMLEKEELYGVEVNMAAKDTAGNVWYATHAHGVKVEKQDGTWLHFEEESSDYTIPANRIHRIRFTTDNETILIGNLGSAVINDDFEVIQTRSWITFNNDHINDIVKDSEGNYWVANNRGIYRGDTIEDWVAEHVEDLYPDDPKVPVKENPITVIQEDTEGNIWFASHLMYGRDGIFCYTAQGEWEQYTVSETDGLDLDIIQDITVNTDTGHVWFASQGGNVFYRFDNKNGWSGYSADTLGLVSNGLHSAVYDNSTIWFTTQTKSGVHGHGTGVHELILDSSGDIVEVQTYDYISTSTNLPSNRCGGVAADKNGGVWFGAYDFPRISYRDPDGEWTVFDGEISDATKTIEFNTSLVGFTGIVVDSNNIVYFAQSRSAPFAYDTDNETLLPLDILEDVPVNDPLYYGVYLDLQDGKWFHTAQGVIYLSPDNSSWEYYSTADGLQNNITEDVQVDVYGNVWIPNRGGVAMKSHDGTWYNFQNHDESGFFSSPRKILLDDNREAWSGSGQKYDYVDATWSSPDNKEKLENRNIWYATGGIFIGQDTSQSRGVILDIDEAPIGQFNQELTALDTEGNIYIVQWGFDNHWGVHAFQSGTTYDEEYDAIITFREMTPFMYKGQSKEILLTMRNVGTKTWEKDEGFYLGAVGNYDDLTGVWRNALDQDVLPGKSNTFTLEFYSGDTGTFTTEWRMLQEKVTWFGDTFTDEINVIQRTGIENKCAPSKLLDSCRLKSGIGKG